MSKKKMVEIPYKPELDTEDAEVVALHLQKGEIRDEQGRIIGWKTCDCRACTIVGRSPCGPDFRYGDE